MAQSLRHTTPLASSVSHRRLSVYSVVKEQHCRPLAPGGSVRFSRTAGHLIPESHQRRRESMECCRIDVDSTAKRHQSAVTSTALFAKAIGPSGFTKPVIDQKAHFGFLGSMRK